ncbi:SDR family oxidoreductase [Providencia rettgeri]|uniref:SDR family oxidoreductase n=1 Tax=Providencia rettgeri TaxID=587 RepID=UPI0001C3497C|nr:SDR family oxidoreductase [Providencia rettgeri]QXA59589.1 SDR family oxidoreductase [Providencia rettgeri]
MSTHRNSLRGKTVLITGGAKNLGGRLARDFAVQGVSSIAIHYHSNTSQQAASETIAAIRRYGIPTAAFQADLTSPEAIKALFQNVTKQLGPIDIAINTVGQVLKKPIIDVTEAEYDAMSDINAKAAFFFLKEAGVHLNDHGKICTVVTSLLGAFTPFYAAYAGLKAPVEHFTRAAAKEFGSRGISVTAIGPGPMDTPFFYPAESKEAITYHQTAAALSAHSATGLTDLSDIVPWVRFLVSEGWWMTGQTLLVNGGYTTK